MITELFSTETQHVWINQTEHCHESRDLGL
jgi:hypothetical protein